MLRFASSRFPTCARLVALRPAIRLSHTDVDRLSAGELRQKLDSTAQPADTITVDIKSKTEQSQSGYVHDSYNIKGAPPPQSHSTLATSSFTGHSSI